MVLRIQPYILLLSLVTALWLLFYLRFVYEVNFCHCLLNSTLAGIPPLHPVTTEDLKMWGSLIVVGHLQDIESQHISSEKSLEHILIFGRELFHAILNIQVHVT